MDFISRVASFSPVPAGGAAVANCFCLAIALIYKVVLFETERNYHNPEMSQNLLGVKKEIERLLRDAERLVDEDSETYLKFAESRRRGDKTQMKQHFNEIIEVSMNGELLMGAINGTVHIVKANLRVLKSPEKRENYSKRLYHLHLEYKNRHQKIMGDLGQFSEDE
jgi:formiminotetrahydrofolate cyclodeaminase